MVAIKPYIYIYPLYTYIYIYIPLWSVAWTSLGILRPGMAKSVGPCLEISQKKSEARSIVLLHSVTAIPVHQASWLGSSFMEVDPICFVPEVHLARTSKLLSLNFSTPNYRCGCVLKCLNSDIDENTCLDVGRSWLTACSPGDRLHAASSRIVSWSEFKPGNILDQSSPKTCSDVADVVYLPEVAP